MARRRSDPGMALGEILLWILFFALLVPAGVTGWAIGHYTGQKTRTVTVSASGTPATTSAATTAAATTQQATTAASTQQTTASTQKTTTASAAPSPAGNAAQAKAVFTSSGCGACHTLKAAGSTATVGPDLDTKLAADAKKAHMPLAAFTLQSIVNPNAYIASGYPKGVMPPTFGKQLSKAQLAALVSFVAGGK